MLIINQLIILSPLEQFEVISLFNFNTPFFGYFNFTLTNLGLYSIMIFILILSLHIMGNNELKLLPSKWSIALESLFLSVNSMVREQIGTSNEIYLPAKRSGKTLLRVWLSNSGDVLKLIVPNYNWKIISGWINYSCTVTSYKIDEKKMGYRGSKIELNKNSVKEQRVNGSQWINYKPIHLRYTLMDSEKNYRIKILSKQLKLNTLSFSTLNNNKTKMNPWFVTGLIDGEGSFFTSIFKTNLYKLGWYLKTNFAIGLGKNDLSLLLQLQPSFAGVESDL